MKKVLVIAYFAKNFGDDLFLKILFERYKNVEWTMDTFDENYREIFSEYKNVNIIRTLKHRILRKLNFEELSYKKYDAVVFIGGSIFMEIENWRSTYAYRQKMFKFFENKPVFFIGCNFGPYRSKEFIEKYRNVFKKSKDICFRDEYSFNLFSDLSNTRIAPDIVFQLKTKEVEKSKNSLGISLIDLSERSDLKKYQDAYIRKIVDIVNEAISRKIKVTFFSFCERQGDMKVIKEVVNNIEAEYSHYMSIENYNGDIEKFLRKFKSMENIIGTRFHACILSQVFGQGLYPLVYSNKTYNVLKDVELEDEYIYIKDINNLDYKNMLDIISNNKINSNEIFLKAEEQFEVLDEFIKKN